MPDILNDQSIELAAAHEAQSFPQLLSMLEVKDFTSPMIYGIFSAMVPDTDTINVMATNANIEKNNALENLWKYRWLDYINKSPYLGPWEQLFANLRLLRLRREANEFRSKAEDTDIPQEFLQKAGELAAMMPSDNSIAKLIEGMGIDEKTLEIGYPLIDGSGGIPYGSVFVIASETSVGKTTLAINIMAKLLRKNIPVHYVSLEMSAKIIGTRILQCANKASFGEARSGASCLDEFSGKLVIDDRKTKLSDILASMSAKSAHKIHIIDHLHIVNYGQKSNSRLAELEDMTRRFKEFAQQSGRIVILLSQLNREVSKMSRPPQLSDLRGSGSIEQDADIVTMLHDPNRREDESKGDVRKTAEFFEGKQKSYGGNDRIWYIRKNRYGPCGECNLSFNPVTMTFL